MVNKKSIHIVHLYPHDMNIYGDSGNVLALQYRLSRRGYQVQVTGVNTGEAIPKDVDILVAGGGQDSGQERVLNDLKQKKPLLQQLAKDGVSMLVVCGMYQLFGHEFITHDKKRLEGVSIFDLHTIGQSERLIGNVVIQSDTLGTLVGFENHSGQTFLAASQPALGKVIKGEGNNSQGEDEGALIDNVFGTYLHGPALPKNPLLADELIQRALNRKFGDTKLPEIDSRLELLAAEVASSRPR